jgi:uncharacterized protein (TIGR03067 family)
MRWQRLMALFGGFLILGSLASAEDAKDDAKKLDGDWVLLEGEVGGEKLPAEVIKTVKLTLKGDSYVASVSGRLDKGTITILPDKKPKAMDITGTEGPNKDKTIPAIYELDGDTLKICYALEGGKRPTEFKAKGDAKLFLATYRRSK